MPLLLALALAGPAEPFDAVPVEPPIPHRVRVLTGDASPTGDALYVVETPFGSITRPWFGAHRIELTSGGLYVVMRQPTRAKVVTIDEFTVRGGRLQFVRQIEE